MMVRVLVVISAFLLAVPGLAGAKEVNKDIHRSFDVSPGAVLRLAHGDGDVFITPWDKNSIEVDIRYRGEVKLIGFGGEMDLEVEFRQEDNTITIKGKEKGTGSVGIVYRNLSEYVYEIQAPAYVELDLEGEDGGVTVADWKAGIRCQGDDGDIRFTRVKADRIEIKIEDGDVELEEVWGDVFVDGDDGNVTVLECRLEEGRFRLEDGDLVLSRCEGDCDIEVDDGDVSIRRSRLGRSVIRTEDGDVDLEIVSGRRMDVDVVTADGAVRLNLDDAASVSFYLETDDGTIRVDAPGSERMTKTEHRVSGTLGDGNGEIRIRTEDGDVTLAQGGRATGE